MEPTSASILLAQAEHSPALLPILLQAGFSAVEAANAHTLAAQLEEIAPQLLILDCAFPGVDAFALCADLTAASTVPVLMLTPDDEDAIERAFQSGAHDVLVKPVRPALLLRRVQALLAAGSSRNTDQRVLAEALRNTASALSSTLDRDELLERILEQVNVVVPSESANIMLIESDVAYVARSRGYDNRPDRIPVGNLRMNVQQTPTLRWMIENNRALLIPNTTEYAPWQHFDETDPWLKSYVSAPIHIGTQVIGFLNIDSSVPHHFTEADAEHLQIFADQAAIAIRNATLYNRVRGQAVELERRVLQRTADLDYERSQMRAILDAMTEGVAYTEAAADAYRTLYVNRALTELSGYSSEEWKLASLSLFRPKGMSDVQFAQQTQDVAQSLRTRGFWQQDLHLMRKDGSEFDSIVIVTRVDNTDRDIVGLVTVVRDVSQERALQQQKERFVAYASHELRTPITNLKTRLYLMQRQPERMDEHMQVLEYVTDRMKHLVEDLLDISRFERGVITLELEDVVLQDLILKLVRVQLPEAQHKQITLTCQLEQTPVHVAADHNRLAQVITNLLSNAINYTPRQGKIVVQLTTSGAQALVEIQDSGIGISEDHLPHIFQPFYRVVSQVEGSGLGLSITREIVELHGGSIDVISQPGVGSTFCFRLPLLSSPNA